MKNNIKIYGIKDVYIKYLSQYQEHLFLHERGMFGRKYIGTVLEINGFSYFAPLSSFKHKHKKMKEGVDFIKIKDYAVININNMLPAHHSTPLAKRTNEFTVLEKKCREYESKQI